MQSPTFVSWRCYITADSSVIAMATDPLLEYSIGPLDLFYIHLGVYTPGLKVADCMGDEDG